MTTPENTYLHGSNQRKKEESQIDIDVPTPVLGRENTSDSALFKNRSLIEIIHGKTHTAVGDIQFDCPPMVFSPHPKVLAQYGGVTVVE